MLIFKRILFYILSFTWGIIMSFIGLWPILILACMKRVHVFHGRLYGIIGKNWGGVNFGCFFLCCENSAEDDNLRKHECGHGIQNIIFGPLMPFVVAIPSAIRYWYREMIWRRDQEKYWKLPNYDAIWFEGWATKLGEKYILTDRI